jgi:hypothetical protein
MTLAFPKPKDEKRQPVAALLVFPDGREVCNLDTAAGTRLYVARIQEMAIRQDCRCCLESYAPACPGSLSLNHATLEHEHGRGSGGSKRDDRTVLPNGTWINGAAHRACNSWKGSRYIDYNRGFQRG